MGSGTDLAITFFTTLTVLANLAVLAVVGLAVSSLAVGSRGGAPARLWSAVRTELTPTTSIAVAWVVAAVATTGSLYFSEGAGFVPCRLCWVQRGFMYPLVAVLFVVGWAASRPGSAPGYRWARRLAMAMSVLGAGVAVYHVLIERYPSLEAAATCSVSNPCSLKWFERLGFVTLPYMSLSAFLLVLTLLALAGDGTSAGTSASVPTDPARRSGAPADTPSPASPVRS